MAKEFKLDIFVLLEQINSGNYEYFSGLTPEQQKGFAPSVVARWLCGTSDLAQIYLMNKAANPYLFSLGKHPDLLYRLMVAAASKVRGRRYYWLPVASAGKQSMQRRAIMEYYGYSTREFAQMFVRPKAADIMDMAEQLGWDKEDIAKLKKEIG